MSNFTRAQPAGWGVNDIPTASQYNQIDEDHAKTANFSDGSTHSPTAAVVVGGAGMSLNPCTIASGAYANIESGGHLWAQAGSTTQLDGTVYLAGSAMYLEKLITSTSTGRVAKRLVLGADADTAYDIEDGDIIRRASGLGANRTYTLGTTGAVAGDVIEFCNLDTTYHVQVGAWQLKLASGSFFSARFLFNGVAWETLSLSPYDP